MPNPPGLEEIILPAWETNARVTRLFVTSLPASIWDQAIPGAPHRTPRMIAGHLHNARCMWVRTLGRPHGIRVPRSVDRRLVKKADLVRALGHSTVAIRELLRLGCARGGRIPPTPAYVWRNLALDVGHVLTYFVAHEGHHRGQLTLLARQVGVPLPATARKDLWQWKPPARR
jgi:DinB family